MKRFLSTPFLSSLVSTILIKLIYETRVNFRHYIDVWLCLFCSNWPYYIDQFINLNQIKQCISNRNYANNFWVFRFRVSKTILPLFHCWIDITSFEKIQKDQFYYLNIMVNAQCTYLLTLIYKYSKEASIAETWFEIVEMLKTANKVIFLCPEF